MQRHREREIERIGEKSVYERKWRTRKKSYSIIKKMIVERQKNVKKLKLKLLMVMKILFIKIQMKSQ